MGGRRQRLGPGRADHQEGPGQAQGQRRHEGLAVIAAHSRSLLTTLLVALLLWPAAPARAELITRFDYWFGSNSTSDLATQVSGSLSRELAQRVGVGVVGLEAEFLIGPSFGFATHFGYAVMGQSPSLTVNNSPLANIVDSPSFTFLWYGVDVLKVRLWRNDETRSHFALALGYYGYKNPTFPSARVLFVSGQPAVAVFDYTDVSYNGLAITAETQLRVLPHMEVWLRSTLQPFVNGGGSFGTLNDLALRFHLFPYWRASPNVAFRLGYRFNLYRTSVRGQLNLIDASGGVVATEVNETLTDIFHGPVLGVDFSF